MSNPVVIPSFGGDAAVGSIATQYPFQPNVDVTNVLGASNGVASDELVKLGTATVSVAATGTASDAVTFADAFPVACDAVLVTLTGLGGAVVNGPAYVTDVTAAGFTANVDVTTAGSGSVTVQYIAFGH